MRVSALEVCAVAYALEASCPTLSLSIINEIAFLVAKWPARTFSAAGRN
jgi:hypothetical protein